MIAVAFADTGIAALYYAGWKYGGSKLDACMSVTFGIFSFITIAASVLCIAIYVQSGAVNAKLGAWKQKPAVQQESQAQSATKP